jgi:hypothetical protein
VVEERVPDGAVPVPDGCETVEVFVSDTVCVTVAVEVPVPVPDLLLLLLVVDSSKLGLDEIMDFVLEIPVTVEPDAVSLPAVVLLVSVVVRVAQPVAVTMSYVVSQPMPAHTGS